MSIGIRASVGSTLARIDLVLAEMSAPLASCARQADELAVIVDHLAAEERAGGGRDRTVTALGLIARAIGELAQQLRVSGVRS